MRLRQIATERKFGEYRAYAEIVVPQRRDIRFAEEILQEAKN
jgi:hypothetical protein